MIYNAVNKTTQMLNLRPSSGGITLKVLCIKLLYLLIFMSGSVSASPSSTLYVKIKNNNVCVFTKGVMIKHMETRL